MTYNRCAYCDRIIVAAPTDNGGEEMVHWGTARPTCDPDAVDDPWAPRAVFASDLDAIDWDRLVAGPP